MRSLTTGQSAVLSATTVARRVEARTAALKRANEELQAEIAERQRVEAALRVSEARERARAADLKAIMDAVPAVIWIARDPEGNRPLAADPKGGKRAD